MCTVVAGKGLRARMMGVVLAVGVNMGVEAGGTCHPKTSDMGGRAVITLPTYRRSRRRHAGPRNSLLKEAILID